MYRILYITNCANQPRSESRPARRFVERSRWKMERVIQFGRDIFLRTDFVVSLGGGGVRDKETAVRSNLKSVLSLRKNVLFSACRHRKLNVRRDEPQTKTRPPKNICFWLRKGSSGYLFKRLLELRQTVLKINEKEKCSGYLEHFLYLYFQDNIKISQILSDEHHRLPLYR